MLVEKSMHPEWLSNAFVVAAEGGPAVFIDSGADVAPLIDAVERCAERERVLAPNGAARGPAAPSRC